MSVLTKDENHYAKELEKYKTDIYKKLVEIAAAKKPDSDVIEWKKGDLDVNLLMLSVQYESMHGQATNNPNFKVTPKFKEFQKKLEKEGIWFWTPSRKNMKEKKQENSKFLKKKRKYIETVFSKLVNLFDIERIRVQSILGFRLRLEQCLLVYTIKNELAQ